MFRRPHRSGFPIALCLTVAALSAVSVLGAEGTRQWAVLIAVQKHERSELNLRYTERDVEQLKTTLVERAGLPAGQILLLTGENGSLAPTLENIRREAPKFLAQAGPDDQAIVFFSGHGDNAGGQTHLVPSDYDPERPAETGLPAGELRAMLARCRARMKLLALDCCHAGGTRSARASLDAESLAKDIVREPVGGCVVLGSCRAEEKSWEWPERQQGVFTYWLCRALEGGADENGDGALTVDEVYRYTHERVARTAKQVFDASQRPVRIIGGEIDGVPIVLNLLPEPPETVCRRLAEHIDLEVRGHHLKAVGVLEFSRWGEGLAAANLPRYCAEQLRDTLARLGEGTYRVPDSEAMDEAAQKSRFMLGDIGDPDRMGLLGKEAGGLEAVVHGTLRRRGSKLLFQCDLVSVTDGNSLATPSGVLPDEVSPAEVPSPAALTSAVVPLSESLVADNGASFDNRQRPSGPPYATEVVAYTQHQASAPHPMLDPGFPFRVEIWSIDARPGERITPATPRRRKEFIQLPAAPGREQTELLIAAREDEQFEVRLWNRLGSRVGVRLLMDGLNSLEQRRERLDGAAYWVVEPTGDWSAGGKGAVIAGWHLRQGTATGSTTPYTVKRFKFVDMARGVATREGFGESIGLITAAFYFEGGRGDRSTPGRLAIGEGQVEEQELPTVPFRLGQLAGVVQIRYVSEAELEQLLNQ